MINQPYLLDGYSMPMLILKIEYIGIILDVAGFRKEYDALFRQKKPLTSSGFL